MLATTVGLSSGVDSYNFVHVADVGAYGTFVASVAQSVNDGQYYGTHLCLPAGSNDFGLQVDIVHLSNSSVSFGWRADSALTTPIHIWVVGDETYRVHEPYEYTPPIRGAVDPGSPSVCPKPDQLGPLSSLMVKTAPPTPDWRSHLLHCESNPLANGLRMAWTIGGKECLPGSVGFTHAQASLIPTRRSDAGWIDCGSAWPTDAAPTFASTYMQLTLTAPR